LKTLFRAKPNYFFFSLIGSESQPDSCHAAVGSLVAPFWRISGRVFNAWFALLATSLLTVGFFLGLIIDTDNVADTFPRNIGVALPN
jgi:hypothetical protein